MWSLTIGIGWGDFDLHYYTTVAPIVGMKGWWKVKLTGTTVIKWLLIVGMRGRVS